jgi:hypothetical protein
LHGCEQCGEHYCECDEYDFDDEPPPLIDDEEDNLPFAISADGRILDVIPPSVEEIPPPMDDILPPPRTRTTNSLVQLVNNADTKFRECRVDIDGVLERHIRVKAFLVQYLWEQSVQHVEVGLEGFAELLLLTSILDSPRSFVRELLLQMSAVQIAIGALFEARYVLFEPREGWGLLTDMHTFMPNNKMIQIVREVMIRKSAERHLVHDVNRPVVRFGPWLQVMYGNDGMPHLMIMLGQDMHYYERYNLNNHGRRRHVTDIDITVNPEVLKIFLDHLNDYVRD